MVVPRSCGGELLLTLTIAQTARFSPRQRGFFISPVFAIPWCEALPAGLLGKLPCQLLRPSIQASANLAPLLVCAGSGAVLRGRNGGNRTRVFSLEGDATKALISGIVGRPRPWAGLRVRVRVGVVGRQATAGVWSRLQG